MRTLGRILVGIFVVAATFVAAPANAFADPIISPLDTSTPGHVKGTVTTDAPYVLISGFEFGEAVITTSGGVGSFDLETWGATNTFILAWSCADGNDYNTCAPNYAQAYFTASDVVPTITWPSDLKIGPGETFSVTSSDPQGGGRLIAYWQGIVYDLNRNGTTELPDLTDGSGALYVYRCGTVGSYGCNEFSNTVKTPLEVRKSTRAELSVATANNYGGYISTGQPSLNFLVRTYRASGLPYTLDWHLEQAGIPVPDTGGVATGTLSGAGETNASITADGVADGVYTVEGTLTLHDPEFGELSGPLTGGSAIVDRKPASYARLTKNTSTIFPYIGSHGYDDWAVLTFTGMYGGRKLEIFSAADVLVRRVNLTQSTSTSTTWVGRWSGRDANSAVVPTGRYTVYLVDTAGNRSGPVTTLYVDHRKLVVRTYTKTVSAAGSMISRYVGKCSTLKNGVRGWYGSLGYYANTRCGTQTGEASEVHTVHELKLPTARDYKTLEVKVYGGASTSRTWSEGIILYSSNHGRFYYNGRAGAQGGTYTGYTVNAPSYVWSDHYFVWAFATAFNNRYDVKNFTVICEYYAAA